LNLTLKTYNFLRFNLQQNAIDSAADAAHGYGLPVTALAQFLIVVGVDVAMLALIA
jgi:hypothetical protein